jgi:hypothetical protein
LQLLTGLQRKDLRPAKQEPRQRRCIGWSWPQTQMEQKRRFQRGEPVHFWVQVNWWCAGPLPFWDQKQGNSEP